MDLSRPASAVTGILFNDLERMTQVRLWIGFLIRHQMGKQFCI